MKQFAESPSLPNLTKAPELKITLSEAEHVKVKDTSQTTPKNTPLEVEIEEQCHKSNAAAPNLSGKKNISPRESSSSNSTVSVQSGSAPKVSPGATGAGGEPRVIKKGDQVITSYVDEKTGKITVYEPGIKLEVSDYAGKWYPAKVVEVDGDENEILVHFEHWSARFDEWIKMDSNRLRPSPNTNIVK